MINLNNKLPELWDDEDIKDIVNKIYAKCFDSDCSVCPYKHEIEKDTCKVDIIMELWRKLENEKSSKN